MCQHTFHCFWCCALDYCAKRFLRPGPRKCECPSVRPSVCHRFLRFLRRAYESRHEDETDLETNLLSKCPMVRCIFNLPYLRGYLELEAHILWEKIWERGVNAFGTLFYSNCKFSTPLFGYPTQCGDWLRCKDFGTFESEKCSIIYAINIIFHG